MDSILTSIKKLLGLAEEDESFDTDITMHINSAIFRLKTLGVGPTEPFIVTDKTSTWSELLEGRTDLESVQIYVYLVVRLIFDPPSTSFVIESFKNRISEMEWMITEQAAEDLA